VAKDVLEQFSLDHVHVIPCALPPHKTMGILAAASDRLEMIQRALQNQCAVSVSDIEIRRCGISYTIDTVADFRERYSDEVKFFFMLGRDAFLDIHTWKSYRQLFKLTAFILMTRPQTHGTPTSLHAIALDYARRRLSKRYALAENGQALIHPDLGTIYLASVTPVAIGSTQIRSMIRKGESIRPWVHPAVSEYIEKKGLYR
jgi:nicotinate-nucleotide adenylyltransferase